MSEIWLVAQALGLVASIMSLVLLFKLGFDVSLVAPFKLMLNYYQQVVEFLLGWAEPYLRIVLKYLSDRMPIDLQLYPHWKHLFVPMWLYFSADAKTIWRDQRKSLALFTAAWGGLVALAASVASSTMPLDAPSMLPMIFPAAGFVVYSSVTSALSAISQSPGISQSPNRYTRWQIFSYYEIAFALGNALIAGVLIFVGLLLQARHLGFSSLNIVLLILFVIAMALRNIVVSAYIAAFDRAEGQRWIDRFRGLATQRHGFLILVSVGGAALFIACSAGLQLAGL